MVSSSWCGDNTNAPPGSSGPVAFRPAIVCAQPHTAPIGGREIPARRRVTALATNRNVRPGSPDSRRTARHPTAAPACRTSRAPCRIARSCDPVHRRPASPLRKGRRVTVQMAGQLPVVGSNLIRQRRATNRSWGAGLSLALLPTTARGALVLFLARIQDSPVQQVQYVLHSVDFVLQMIDFVSGDRSTDDEESRKNCDCNPHRTSCVWCAWPLHQCLLGIGLKDRRRVTPVARYRRDEVAPHCRPARSGVDDNMCARSQAFELPSHAGPDSMPTRVCSGTACVNGEQTRLYDRGSAVPIANRRRVLVLALTSRPATWSAVDLNRECADTVSYNFGLETPIWMKPTGQHHNV